MLYWLFGYDDTNNDKIDWDSEQRHRKFLLCQQILKSKIKLRCTSPPRPKNRRLEIKKSILKKKQVNFNELHHIIKQRRQFISC